MTHTLYSTERHLVFWFSAGAFVLLGFPISMYGIVMHLANYNQPNVQCYIVRILWMVPIYSFESWLCLRFKSVAIYIETLRDCYESYVLYSFLQYLIQVLGGEEELILMLKDKSATRGVHMWGLQYCVRPWIMGQPVSRTIVTGPSTAVKRVHWTSPFFVRCKFGTLQYVLLKFVSSIFVMILELTDLYKEGDFTVRGGYLYICILTNLSQCWALYCLIFFYLATKNELSPINPIGKFLAVKALVFFTWWQSVAISIVNQLEIIPEYDASNGMGWTSAEIGKAIQDYLICIEMFFVAIVLTCVFPHTDFLAAAVAARKQTQHHPSKRRLGRKRHSEGVGWLYSNRDDRSVCSKNSFDVEMASQQSDSLPESPRGVVIPQNGSKTNVGVGAGNNRTRKGDGSAFHDDGYRTNNTDDNDFDRHAMRLSVGGEPVEEEEEHDLVSSDGMEDIGEDGDDTDGDDDDDDDGDDDAVHADDTNIAGGSGGVDDVRGNPYQDSEGLSPEQRPPPMARTGFVRAFLDSTIPRDVIDNSVGIVKGDFKVEKKTLLHHATTSDQYDLFARKQLSRGFHEQPPQSSQGQEPRTEQLPSQHQ